MKTGFKNKYNNIYIKDEDTIFMYSLKVKCPSIISIMLF